MNSFILRRITSDNRESNELIGTSYFFIYDDRKIKPNNEFDESDNTSMSKSYLELLKDYPEESHSKIHAFIISGVENIDRLNQRIIPIYSDSTHYIMTESGKTFSTIKRCD